MPQLGLLILLLTAPLLEGGAPVSVGTRQLERARFDACAAAERLAAQPPCLRAEDCGALRSWKRLFGAPRVEPLEPQLAARASRGEVPPSYLCLARAASGARQHASGRP